MGHYDNCRDDHFPAASKKVEQLDTKAWVMVPVEPTEEMVDAGGRQQASGRGGPDSIYRAMLSASPSLPVVDGGAFTHVAKTKLEGLLADGWQINGYSIHKDDRLGLVTTGAFVGWYTNACEAMEAAESRVLSLEEALRAIVERAKAASSGGSLAALSGLSGMEQIARNALKVNGNG